MFYSEQKLPFPPDLTATPWMSTTHSSTSTRKSCKSSQPSTFVLIAYRISCELPNTEMHVAAATSSALNVKLMLNVAANAYASSDPIIRPASAPPSQPIKSPLADTRQVGRALDDDSSRGRTPRDPRPQQMNYLPSATFPIALSERSSRPASRIAHVKSQQSTKNASRRAVPFAAAILPLDLSLNPPIAPKSRWSPPQIWVTDEQGCVLVRRAAFAPPPCSCPCTCQEEEEERKTAPNLDDDLSFPNISVDVESVKPNRTFEDDESALEVVSSEEGYRTRTDSPVQLRLDLRRHRSLDRLDSTHSTLCIPTDDPLHASSLDHLDHLNIPRDSSPDPLSPLPRFFRIPHPFSSPQCEHHSPDCVFNPTPPVPAPKKNLQDFIRSRLERSPPRGSRSERQRSPPMDKRDRNPFARSERERLRDLRSTEREERASKWSFTNPSSPRMYTERIPPSTPAPLYDDTNTTERLSRWSRIPPSPRSSSQKSTPPPYSAPAVDRSFFDDEIPIVTLGSRRHHGASMPPALGRRDTESSDDTHTNDTKIDYLHPHRIPRYIIAKVRLSQQAKETKKSAAKDKEREMRRERERSTKEGEKGTTTSAAGIRSGFVVV
ncbi:hypothetical protein BJ742DRAFT_161373 [Cladochytrium replicatum]|nr:hypothetical protein BJ742DRAFT_161373 [Cladochytrium replicatum]